MNKLNFLLIFGLLLISPLNSHASLIEDKKCSTCHRFSKADKGKEGPDLFYAGDKFKGTWLKEYLQNPVTLRKAGTINSPGFLKGTPGEKHPALSKEEAEKITTELMALTIPDLPVEEGSPLSKGQIAKTKYEFERTFSCISCHQSLNLAGKPRGGISGPSLVDAGNRLQANWVSNWLKDPKIFTDKSRMPVFKMDDETRLRFTQFIMTLKKEKQR
ncbi:MAG: c-type cytochrome [Nitrospinota bacterium]